MLAVARCGTFRAAAIDLDVSTTALSHTIARLEAGLGVRLFNRTTRSVSLTDAGRLFVGTVGPSVQDLRNALGTVQAHRETPTGTLRINAAPFAARAIMQPLVIAFLTQYPDMYVDLVTEGRMVDIVRDGFDLGVRVASLVPSDMIAVPLGDVQRHAVVATAAFLERHGTPKVPTDLLRQPASASAFPMARSSAGVSRKTVSKFSLMFPARSRSTMRALSDRLCSTAWASAISSRRISSTTSTPGGWCACWKTGPHHLRDCASTIPGGVISRPGCGRSWTWRAPLPDRRPTSVQPQNSL